MIKLGNYIRLSAPPFALTYNRVIEFVWVRVLSRECACDSEKQCDI